MYKGMHRYSALMLDVTASVGSANTFLAMFMVGVMLDVHIDAEDLGSIVRIVTSRYVVCSVVAAIVVMFAPLPLAGRQAAALALMSPFANVNAANSALLGLNERVPAAVATLSIGISTAIMSAMVVALGV